MTRSISLLGLCLLACTATLPEGQYRCANPAECPEGWSCVDGLCYSEPGGAGDAGLDAAPPDADLDGRVVDADASLPDASLPDSAIDAGPTPVTLVALQTLEGEEELGGEFGRAMDLTASRLAVSAPSEGASTSEGAVYLFQRDGLIVLPGPERLTIPSSGNAELGFSVALTTSFLFAGRPGSNEVVRYTLPTEGLPPLTIPGVSGFFGGAIAITEGGDMAVGAYLRSSNAGAVEIMRFDGTMVRPVGRGETARADDVFGSSLASDGGSLLAVGAPSRGSQPGFVVIANSSVGGLIRVESPTTGDKFGVSVAFVGGLLAVGADNNTSGASADGAGRVYLYQPSGSSLGFIESPDTATLDRFGAALCAIGDGLLVVGAPLAAGNQGRAHVYRRSGTTLTRVAELQPPAGAVRFGQACAADSTLAIVGAPGTRVGGSDGAGAAYIYDVSGL